MFRWLPKWCRRLWFYCRVALITFNWCVQPYFRWLCEMWEPLLCVVFKLQLCEWCLVKFSQLCFGSGELALPSIFIFFCFCLHILCAFVRSIVFFRSYICLHYICFEFCVCIYVNFHICAFAYLHICVWCKYLKFCLLIPPPLDRPCPKHRSSLNIIIKLLCKLSTMRYHIYSHICMTYKNIPKLKSTNRTSSAF